MLWYKAWLETWTRFVISLLGITALCAYRVYDLAKDAPPWTKPDYFYFVLRSGHQLIGVMWMVAITLLLMGGLLREKAAGVSSFTLAFPVSRARLMGVRIGMGCIQALALAVVPWVAIVAIAVATAPVRPLAQAWFHVVLLAGGGSVMVGVALLVSSVVEGEYTAPMINLGIVLACASAPKALNSINPVSFIGGRDYLGPANMLIGPIPWMHVAANICVAAVLIFVSVKLVERRDF